MDQSTSPLLDCRGVRKSFGAMVAVKDFSFTIHKGEVLGIGGPNGAGKTTLFELISGLSPADHGEILFEGRRVEGVPAHSICHLGIARVFQSNAAFDSLTAHHNVLIAAAYGNSPGGCHPFPSTRQFVAAPRRRWFLWAIKNHWARSLEICLF